jgi:hypothetical protein
LRVSNKSAEFLEIASGILESAVGSLLKAADSGEARRFSPLVVHSELEDEDSIDTFLAQAGTANGFFDVSMDTSDFA